MTMTASAELSARTCLIALVYVCVAVLSGCTGSDPVREQWVSREPLPTCGSLRLQQGEELKVNGKNELACLRGGLDSGRGGELVVQYPTTEGDPITEYYRVTPDGTTEVYTDSTEDAFSDQKWSFGECDRPESVLDVAC